MFVGQFKKSITLHSGDSSGDEAGDGDEVSSVLTQKNSQEQPSGDSCGSGLSQEKIIDAAGFGAQPAASPRRSPPHANPRPVSPALVSPRVGPPQHSAVAVANPHKRRRVEGVDNDDEMSNDEDEDRPQKVQKGPRPAAQPDARRAPPVEDDGPDSPEDPEDAILKKLADLQSQMQALKRKG
jgi:hypothetical protein